LTKRFWNVSRFMAWRQRLAPRWQHTHPDFRRSIACRHLANLTNGPILRVIYRPANLRLVAGLCAFGTTVPSAFLIYANVHFKAVTVKSIYPGKLRNINSVAEAAEFLLTECPGKRGRVHGLPNKPAWKRWKAAQAWMRAPQQSSSLQRQLPAISLGPASTPMDRLKSVRDRNKMSPYRHFQTNNCYSVPAIVRRCLPRPAAVSSIVLNVTSICSSG
jgi:hypothetical protein